MKTEEDKVKEEPVSSSNQTVEPNRSEAPNATAQSETRTNRDDFVDDPEAGPSGIKTCARQSCSSRYPSRVPPRRYQDQYSSSDDDSDDEIVQSTLWRSRGSFNLNQNEPAEQSPQWHPLRTSNDSNLNELAQPTGKPNILILFIY